MSARPNRVGFERHEPASSKTDKIPSRKKKGKKKTRHQLQQLQAVALGGEERERPAEGGEQLTRSDTGKRGDLIAQLAKSTGRKQQERLVPSVWLGSPPLLVGPSVAFLCSLHPPSHPPFPRTAACHGSLHRNKMISPHLLVNTGHRGSHAKAGPFVLDRDH